MKLLQRIGYHPTVMRLYAKFGYPLMTRVMSGNRGGMEYLFLGPGYEEDPAMGVHLNEADEPNRYPIQLYHRLAVDEDLAGKDVLEVSSGHGGGASYLMRTFKPKSYVGLDLNPAGVTFCRRRHNLPGIRFVQGDAQDLPFPDESFDVVINLEASHSYPDFAQFLAEVARVLRKGGRFLYADLRPRREVEEWTNDLQNCSLTTVSHRVVNPEVMRGYERNSQQRREQIDHYMRFVPRRLRSSAADFAGVEGGGNYVALQSGELSYQHWVMTKE
jgi:ubiquinone/menaquinone biosynthesis C-methylase UbiE